jgi:hypothetical protein
MVTMMITTFMAPSFHNRSHAHVNAARAAKHATPSINMPTHIQSPFLFNLLHTFFRASTTWPIAQMLL